MTAMKELNQKVYNVIGACMEVHKTLGAGYPVEVYRAALEVEFKEKGLTFEPDFTLEIKFKEVNVGEMKFDFLVEESVLLMLRSYDGLRDNEIQQVLRGVVQSGFDIGILINFGMPKIQYKRIMPGHSQTYNQQRDTYRRPGLHPTGLTRENNPIR